jgi:hypothetical protein
MVKDLMLDAAHALPQQIGTLCKHAMTACWQLAKCEVLPPRLPQLPWEPSAKGTPKVCHNTAMLALPIHTSADGWASPSDSNPSSSSQQLDTSARQGASSQAAAHRLVVPASPIAISHSLEAARLPAVSCRRTRSIIALRRLPVFSNTFI